jgi:hypothetical protein
VARRKYFLGFLRTLHNGHSSYYGQNGQLVYELVREPLENLAKPYSRF